MYAIKVVKQEMNDGITACQSRDVPTKLHCNTIIHVLFHYFYCINPYFIFKLTIFKILVLYNKHRGKLRILSSIKGHRKILNFPFVYFFVTLL